MRLVTYDYECTTCERVWEQTVHYDERDEVGCDCGVIATRLMSAPTIHTLETHFRGYKGDDGGHFTPSFGEYRDPNLVDKKTGEPVTYSSPREKDRKLAENGLFQLPQRKPQT